MKELKFEEIIMREITWNEFWAAVQSIGECQIQIIRDMEKAEPDQPRWFKTYSILVLPVIRSVIVGRGDINSLRECLGTIYRLGLINTVTNVSIPDKSWNQYSDTRPIDMDIKFSNDISMKNVVDAIFKRYDCLYKYEGSCSENADRQLKTDRHVEFEIHSEAIED